MEKSDKQNDEMILIYENYRELEVYENALYNANIKVFYEEDIDCINKLIDELGVTSVVFHFKYEQYYQIALKCKKMGIKSSVILHCESWYYYCDEWKWNIKSYLGSTLYRVKWHFRGRIYSNIFCVSMAVKKGYRAIFNWSENKMHVLYLGINLETEFADNDIETEIRVNDELLIGCVGFLEVKGLDVLLNAVYILIEKGYKIRLIHVGGSQELNETYKDKILSMAKNMNLDEHILWMGIRNDVTSILKKCDVYCQPSRSEAISLSIMEAMGQSLPIVAANVGGIPELVLEGYNGYLFQSEDAEELAKKLELLINDSDLRIRMGSNSRKIIYDNKFNRVNNIQKFLDIME